MPAHRLTRAMDATERVIDGISWPATIIGLALIAILGLMLAGSTWPPIEPASPNSPVGVVAITPDDPAAPTPVPVQLLGR